MAVATFDTLKFANTLKSAGVPDKQAEAMAEIYYAAFQLQFSPSSAKPETELAHGELVPTRESQIVDDFVPKDLINDYVAIRWLLALCIVLNFVIFLLLMIWGTP